MFSASFSNYYYHNSNSNSNPTIKKQPTQSGRISPPAVGTANNTAKNARKNTIHEPDSQSSNSPSPPWKQQQNRRRTAMTNNSNTNSAVVQNQMNLFVLIRILIRYHERVDVKTWCLAKQVSQLN